MRLLLVFALLALPAGGAFAAPPPGAAAEANLPVCTTTTVVVKRGDVVLSTASKTKCEKVAAATAGGGFHPEAVLKASDILSSFSFGDGGEALSLKNAPADWRVIDVRSGDICHLVLKARPGPAGLPAVSEGCRGALARASTWSFQNGAVDVLAADGARIVRLEGDRRGLSGEAADGHPLQLQR